MISLINDQVLSLEWQVQLADEFHQPYFIKIKAHLLADKAQGKTVFPPANLIFNAFSKTPFDQVKVVILGQDPYHNDGQAMGLSFSVPRNFKIPPSLNNIYKELKSEYPDFVIPNHGDLSYWAEQGVLLLNASLTVNAHQAGSHSKIGWQSFTDAVIAKLSTEKEHIVFLLWGNFAKSKAVLIDQEKHLVLTAAHPSPLAGGKFFGCQHFVQTNDYLCQKGLQPINWQLDC